MLTLSEDTTMKLLESLGLDPATATDADVSTALDEVEAYDPEAMENMAEEKEKLEEELANRDLDAAGIKEAGDRETWKALLLSNRAEALKALGSIKNRQPQSLPALTNRVTLRTPGNNPGAAADTSTLRNRAVAEFQASNKCDFETAWNAVRLAKPNLFTKGE